MGAPAKSSQVLMRAFIGGNYPELGKEPPKGEDGTIPEAHAKAHTHKTGHSSRVKNLVNHRAWSGEDYSFGSGDS